MGEARCKHGKTWLVAGGHICWCYECGAIREMRLEPPNICLPVSGWQKPVGRGGENPYGKVWGKRDAG